MTTDPTITASLAAACAAHDRHRLDVLDALLDEAAPTAVRELLGAALDLCATLRTERDEREEAIGATFAKHRAEIDAATAQLAAARQVIDEERATVARLTARVAELEATGRAIKITPTLLAAALVGSRDGSVTPAAAAQAEHLLKLAGELVIQLPAQDRAEELTRAYGIEAAAVTGSRRDSADSMRRALVSLGAPATTPTAAIDRSLALTAASLLRDIVMNGGLAEGGEIGPRASDYLDMMRRLETTPTAAPGLVAAVSVEDLACAWFNVHGGDVKPSDIDDRDRAHVRAVLARLDATTIAPVDPREFALVLIMGDLTDYNGDVSTTAVAAAARYALTAAGIPVTPEVGK
jgi:hypothetical protein